MAILTRQRLVLTILRGPLPKPERRDSTPYSLIESALVDLYSYFIFGAPGVVSRFAIISCIPMCVCRCYREKSPAFFPLFV